MCLVNAQSIMVLPIFLVMYAHSWCWTFLKRSSFAHQWSCIASIQLMLIYIKLVDVFARCMNVIFNRHAFRFGYIRGRCARSVLRRACCVHFETVSKCLALSAPDSLGTCAWPIRLLSNYMSDLHFRLAFAHAKADILYFSHA